MPKDQAPDPFARRGESRDGKLVLVVCEGAKTEPNYFNGLRQKWKIALTVPKEHRGSDPLSVVDEALRLRDERKGRGKNGGFPAFDEVWCVFDREGIRIKPGKYDQALDKAKGNNLKVAVSTPCFEFWYLLHYRYTAHGFDKCKDVVHALEEFLPDYEKSDSLTEVLEPLTPTALKHAARLRKHNRASDSARPETDVDRLVKSLKGMRRKP